MTLFNLDVPASNEFSSLQRFAGWYIPSNSQVVKLHLYLNGMPYASLSHGIQRPDVAAVFPHLENALMSGFFGDLLLPRTVRLGEELEIQIFDESNSEKLLLFNQTFTVGQATEGPSSRKRAFDLQALLCCPDCGGKLSFGESKGHCETCQRVTYKRDTVPHILEKGDLPFLRIAEQDYTHPYSDAVMGLLEEIGDGIVLDFGAGNTPDVYIKPNICYLDVQQYHHTDVVSNTSKLPFADASFDAVISQAVFEHLPDPFLTARELYRILKPGGLVYVDTAFMQPLHGDPSHYFNMTLHGLRLVMSPFQEVQTGIRPYQYPSFGLIMQIESVLPFIAQSEWKHRLEAFHSLLVKEGYELDIALGSKGRETLAAGVFFEGRK